MNAPDGANVGSKHPPEDSAAAALINSNWKATLAKGAVAYLIGKDVSVVLLFALVALLGYYLPVAFRELRDDAKAERAALTAAAERRENALIELNETTRDTIGQKLDRLADRVNQ